MDIMSHAKSVASNIIANQNGTLPQSMSVKDISGKRTETIGPDTQIWVTTNSPATIISETGSGSIVELVVISPTSNFAVFIQSNGGRVKLEKTYTELSTISEQARDISAFQDADGNYVLNIKDYAWQADMLLMLRSTSDSFKFNQVYANWSIYSGDD